MATDSEYGVFQGNIEEKIKLDAKIITSEVKTHEYSDIEIVIGENGIEEHRPIYPNWTVVDLAVGNLGDVRKDGSSSEEEDAVRKAMETGISLQEWGQRTYQDKRIKSEEYVKIQTEEPVKGLMMLTGYLDHAKIVVEKTKGNGEKYFEEEIVENLPYFKRIEGEDIPIFEFKKIDKTVREFLNLAPECHRLNSYCMARLGLTKSRIMAGAKAIHETHEKRTISGVPLPPECS